MDSSIWELQHFEISPTTDDYIPQTTITSYTSEGITVGTIIMVTLEAILMVVILVENSLLLAAFCCHKRLKRNITNYYLMHLSFADVITGACAIFHILAQVSLMHFAFIYITAIPLRNKGFSECHRY